MCRCRRAAGCGCEVAVMELLDVVVVVPDEVVVDVKLVLTVVVLTVDDVEL